jgi:hypothetical protein
MSCLRFADYRLLTGCLLFTDCCLLTNAGWLGCLLSAFYHIAFAEESFFGRLTIVHARGFAATQCGKALPTDKSLKLTGG